MRYFVEDKTLMSKIVEKVKQSEMERLKKIELGRELFDFWYDQIKIITDEFCMEQSKQMNFFYYVNRQLRTGDYVRYPKEYFYQNEDKFREKISNLYFKFLESGEEVYG